MDRPPPEHGTRSGHSPTHPAGNPGGGDSPHSPSLSGFDDPDPPRGLRSLNLPVPPDPSGAATGPGDPAPTAPIPISPGAAGPGTAPQGPAGSGPMPPGSAGSGPTAHGPDGPSLPPGTAGPGLMSPAGSHPTPPDATGPDPDARYEGNWSDWMMSSDGYPPRPGAGPAEAISPGAAEPREAVAGTGAADSRDHAGTNPVLAVDGTPGSPVTVPGPSTARQRLRDRLTPREGAAPAPPRSTAPPGRTRLLPVLLGGAAVVALAAAAYVQFAVVGAGEPAPSTPAPTEPGIFGAPAPGVPVADPNCPAERTGNTVQGNGPGGTGSGPEVIFGFQYAYYVARSGEQARALVAPEAGVPVAADIQRGIDTIPPGTTHCIRITPGAFVGQYTVAITEHRPETAPVGYNPQLVTTMRIGDRTLITGIGPMP
ncbi:hypothetical protein [Nocardia sp. NPDC051750]|uniref:hypothetical protein n=1 Tax=Nocardia sp. NPDC051750 TaxID=3364325 RepID=UPI0037ADF910